MRIEHIALWTEDLEGSRVFYEKYFQGTSGEKYVNARKNFESYFISFEGGSRLEIMKMPGIDRRLNEAMKEYIGLAHFAISVGSKSMVDLLTEQLRADGFRVIGEPRTTGDGYYESVILDPGGNRVEITE